jgi:hypothetical protein
MTGVMAGTKRGTPPKYRHHKPSGQAVVTINGKDHYLGRYGSASSKALYADWIAKWRRQQAGIGLDRDRLGSLRRKLAMQYHPDRGGNKDIMVGINLALDAVLKLLP